MLLRVISELKPTHFAVTFDLPIPTFRHEAYIAYQAHRPPMEEDLSSQIELVHEVVKSSGLPAYTSERFEADDVIGTLAKQAGKQKGTNVVIVTGDRDILQLVNKKVKVYTPIRGISEARLFDEKEVKEYMGVKPSQIVDYKALIGDSSDNYPGVPGVGPKTATTLLEKYKTLERIYEALGSKGWTMGDNVAGKLKDGRESAFLSQDLAKIRTDAPVKLNLKKAKLPDLAKNEKFIEKLQEFGFRSLITRISGKDQPVSTKVSPRQGKKDNGQMGLI